MLDSMEINNETSTIEFDFEERIRQLWESPEEFFRPEPWRTNLLPDTFGSQSQGYTWATDTPLFAPLEGWPLYAQMIIFSLFFASIILYPIGNVVITMIAKRTVRDTLAAIGPAIIGIGWIVGISPYEGSVLITVTGFLISLACVLYEVIRRQMAQMQEEEQEQEHVPSNILAPLRPILIIGAGILLWHLQLMFFGH